MVTGSIWMQVIKQSLGFVSDSRHCRYSHLFTVVYLHLWKKWYPFNILNFSDHTTWHFTAIMKTKARTFYIPVWQVGAIHEFITQCIQLALKTTIGGKAPGSASLQHKRQLSLKINLRSIVTSRSTGKLIIRVYPVANYSLTLLAPASLFSRLFLFSPRPALNIAEAFTEQTPLLGWTMNVTNLRTSPCWC
jgi:hypothetical protein